MSNKVKSITKGKFNRICEQSDNEQHYCYVTALHGRFIYVKETLSHQYVRFTPLFFYKQCRKGLWTVLSWDLRYKILTVIIDNLDEMSDHDMDLVGWEMVKMKYERLNNVQM